MNALIKRRPGTGTISFHTNSGTWRIRLPGQHGQQLAGFDSRNAAERALEDAARGVPVPRRRRPRTVPRILLRSTLRYALELAERNGMVLEEELRAVGWGGPVSKGEGA